ncbi:sulfur carrier protein ThiS [Actinokineospora bangkokensis]|uniref:Thiamine biosynthesis protein ThiS n=1 Tax=Actinokineospora bangkokensis TaxID=1193682 RepID=A0A1Q9LCR1_9PSEU|nr:sulfur carrier protein ThiS [Actinokineospora bangkokensis]OLR89811.1 thiamine biosynthesis protein ThiS [Actinokineospora bangkokensis]
MTIEVNGSERAVPDGSTVAEVLRLLGLPCDGVAVAVNGVVVPRTQHGAAVVPAWAQVEVLTAVQGG